MQFDRDEFVFLSRRGSVPRISRAGPYVEPDPDRESGAKPRRISRRARQRGGSARALRASIQTTWALFGQDDR